MASCSLFDLFWLCSCSAGSCKRHILATIPRVAKVGATDFGNLLGWVGSWVVRVPRKLCFRIVPAQDEWDVSAGAQAPAGQTNLRLIAGFDE